MSRVIYWHPPNFSQFLMSEANSFVWEYLAHNWGLSPDCAGVSVVSLDHHQCHFVRIVMINEDHQF